MYLEKKVNLYLDRVLYKHSDEVKQPTVHVLVHCCNF